jgi:Zn-finger nucleic acid-binding protein
MPFREQYHKCPKCERPLDEFATVRCPQCNGAWISEDSLYQRAKATAVVNTQLPELDFGEATGQTRYRCPGCESPLDVMMIGNIEIERCPKRHGLWFDAGELQKVLETSGEAKPIDYSPTGSAFLDVVYALLSMLG